MSKQTSHAASTPMQDERLPFTTVLIANRGEIALRVIRACRDMGLRSVAVYSDADREAPHVRLADVAVRLGPAPASESYLNIEKILNAAKETGAQAIHPGYGFLSENPVFADACEAAGLTFVGPTARVMREMGEKTAARRKAQEANVPVTPGYDSGLEDVAQAQTLAERIGYPILLKAAAGGGGKGIRFVHRAEDLPPALRLAQSEAQTAFGDSTVYIEKAVTPARHIEVQLFGDTFGNVIHLGERECSIQRRHQKLIEESPSPVLDEPTRTRILDSAVRLAKSVGYTNAGTAEFLLAPDGQFYFLEINARLQVEHPVTEWRTGVDMVREQLRVAGGLPLSLRQEDVVFRGHAIEARISAEDPFNKFLPAAGVVSVLRDPSGPGVRLDSGLYQGMRIPLFYDPLLAKLICWGANREEAIARLQRALDEYVIAGVRTTIPFAQWLMRQQAFHDGEFSTDFIAEAWHPESSTALPTTPSEGDALADEQVAALVAALVARDQAGAHEARRRTLAGGTQQEEGWRWRMGGRKASSSGW